MAAAGPAKNGAMALLKRGWNEIPDIVAGTGMALVGLAAGGLALYRYYANDMDNRRYKHAWVIMRPEDPRAAFVRKD